MLRIILADDHADVRRGIVEILTDEFSPDLVVEVDGGLDLVDRVLGGEWEIVISDLAMPGCTGLEALKEIRKTNLDIPVIIISSSPAEQYRARVLEAGAEAFINKHSLPAELISTVQQIIDRTRAPQF